MATYLILNLAFMAVVLIVLRALSASYWDKNMTRVLVVLCILTTVFDSLIIIAGIVAYDTTKLLGILLGAAPIEDFMYAVLAVILVPAVWKKLERKNRVKQN